MEMAKVTSKGQITIPISIRKRLNINEGDKLLFINRPDGVVMVNPDMLPGGETPDNTKKAKKAKPQRETSKAVTPKTERPEVIRDTSENAKQTTAVAASLPIDTASKDAPTSQSAATDDASQNFAPVASSVEAHTETTAAPVSAPTKPPAVVAVATHEPTPVTAASEPALSQATPIVAPQTTAPTRDEVESEKSGPKDHGLNLKDLLNEIRSIGSNI
ncbi:MAG: AbrB/MazE/SpoVT family DNA-binding domain-containing protein [Oscillospiraceae bacterium]|nr:AbrB/MazE/SpoVT family DNA-binding domain-containing protein [Oscillospiraceae bacterium]